MVWGTICYEVIVYLEKSPCRLEHEIYIEIFVTDGFDGLKSKVHGRCQQDGAPSHRPQAVKDFLREKNLRIHEHPPNSPDLNPIELIWAEMKSEIEKKSSSTKQELEDTIFDTWNDTPCEVIRSCIDHLHNHLQRVVDADGGWLKQNIGSK
jgi:hypothetical protein